MSKVFIGSAVELIKECEVLICSVEMGVSVLSILSLFCHLMLEIQSFIAVDGLGKEKQMLHGHHFTPLSPELAMRHRPLYRQGNLSTRIESSHAGSPNLHA